MLTDLPDLGDVPGLTDALDQFVDMEGACLAPEFCQADVFDMAFYRRAILESVGEFKIWFDAFPRLCDDPRKDRARRFTTLVYLEHEGLVDLTQEGERIAVTRHEADIEG